MLIGVLYDNEMLGGDGEWKQTDFAFLSLFFVS